MLIRVKITRKENEQFYGVDENAVVEIDLEDYVAGVVASEVGSPHIEAAKAQAVAARTHAYPYYSTGKVISDSSAVNQAFRAKRISESAYPNAVRAARETAGQVLAYNGKVINTCAYSANNGGQTVSSQERWGGYRAWLISQPDPWDIAAGITKKTGHGVGMSHRGAKYAASIGVPYARILAFYYPGTSILNDTEGGNPVNEKAQKVIDAAKSQMGNPYVFGAWGSPCTPAIRRQYSGYNPSHASAIAKKCQVLNGSASTCDGCEWNGKLCFDCRGFTYWCLKQAGITIKGAGATSQYNTKDNWIMSGEIAAGLPNVVCCLFKWDGSVMKHTGLHVGDGEIDHCSAGVQTGKVTDKGWTHYAVPAGLYTAAEVAAAPLVKIVTALKKGMKGDTVRMLQSDLNAVGYDCGTADGIFGTKTENAVRRFQGDNSLAVDGIAGQKTQAALTMKVNQLMDELGGQQPTEIAPVFYTVTVPGLGETEAKQLLAVYPAAVMTPENA